ncbi:MAG TPA: hypothetical protein VHS06_06335 [Chloroflexota bacterium]|nr:hypothetical protein [Chloroflexota bacterium]
MPNTKPLNPTRAIWQAWRNTSDAVLAGKLLPLVSSLPIGQALDRLFAAISMTYGAVSGLTFGILAANLPLADDYLHVSWPQAAAFAAVGAFCSGVWRVVRHRRRGRLPFWGEILGMFVPPNSVSFWLPGAALAVILLGLRLRGNAGDLVVGVGCPLTWWYIRVLLDHRSYLCRMPVTHTCGWFTLFTLGCWWAGLPCRFALIALLFALPHVVVTQALIRRYRQDGSLWRHRSWFFWWRTWPDPLTLEQAIRMQCTGNPEYASAFAEHLAYIDAHLNEPRPVTESVSALRGWESTRAGVWPQEDYVSWLPKQYWIERTVEGRALLSMLGGDAQSEIYGRYRQAVRVWSWAERTRACHALLRADGAAVGPLLAQLQERDPELRQTAAHLLRRIAANTSPHFAADTAGLFCPRCLTVFHANRIRLGRTETITIHGCRSCYQRESAIVRPQQIIAVLDEHMDNDAECVDGTLRANAFVRDGSFDFDAVEIIGASHQQIERFVRLIADDKDALRRANYRGVRVLVRDTCRLTEYSLWLLKKVLGEVVIEGGGAAACEVGEDRCLRPMKAWRRSRWRRVLWCQWRYTSDASFAAELFETIHQGPAHWLATCVLLLLGALGGSIACIVVGIPAANWNIRAARLVVPWSHVGHLARLGAFAGTAVAAWQRCHAGRRISWGLFLEWVVPWLDVRGDPRPGTNDELRVGLLQGFLFGTAFALLAQCVCACVIILVRVSADGAYMPVHRLSIGNTGVYVLVFGLAFGVFGALGFGPIRALAAGMVGVFFGLLFAGMVGGIVGGLALGLGVEVLCVLDRVFSQPCGSGCTGDDALPHRHVCLWWRRQPDLLTLEYALREACLADGHARLRWTKPLAALSIEPASARPADEIILSLQHRDWMEQIRAANELLAIGGEAIEPLLAASTGEGRELRRNAAHMIRAIAEDTTRHLVPGIATLLCSRCLVGVASRRVGCGPGRKVSVYGCRACGQSHSFIERPHQITVVLDDQMSANQEMIGGILRVNWLCRGEVFDFNHVEVLHATDELVLRFAVAVGNDTDPYRLARYPRVHCHVSPGCALSDNSLRILAARFGRVSATP